MARITEQWLRVIIEALYQQSSTTRSEILGKTGLNPASVSHALRHLIEAGVALKTGQLESKAGRRRELLRLNPEAGYLLAIDLEASPIRFALTNLLGDIRNRWEEHSVPGAPLNLAQVANGIKMVCQALPTGQRAPLLAAGVSTPGISDDAGRVTAVNLGWEQFPLEHELSKALSLPFFVENSARSYVMAERSHGRGQHRNDVIYFEVGRGVGAGIVSNGNYYGGRTQVEFGHITVDRGAPDLCKCGKTGCLEAITSAPSVVRQYLERNGSGRRKKGLTVGAVVDLARQKDPVAEAVVDRVASTLGYAASHLVAIFSPELIIFGGYIVSAEDVFLPRIRQELEKHVRPWMGRCELAVSALGTDIGLKGAASRAFYGVLQDSQLLRRLAGLDADGPKGRRSRAAEPAGQTSRRRRKPRA